MRTLINLINSSLSRPSVPRKIHTPAAETARAPEQIFVRATRESRALVSRCEKITLRNFSEIYLVSPLPLSVSLGRRFFFCFSFCVSTQMIRNGRWKRNLNRYRAASDFILNFAGDRNATTRCFRIRGSSRRTERSRNARHVESDVGGGSYKIEARSKGEVNCSVDFW